MTYSKKFCLAIILTAALLIGWNPLHATETKKPIADETFITNSGEKNFKVTSSNEHITNLILKQFEKDILRYACSYKKDRYGRYAEYTITFAKENETKITNFLKSL